MSHSQKKNTHRLCLIMMNFFDDIEKVDNNIENETPNVNTVEKKNETKTIEPDILEIVKKLVVDNVNLEVKLTEIFNKLEPQTEKEKVNENRTDL